MDIPARIMAFRLQAAQRLLYSCGLNWLDTAGLLLRRAAGLGYDKPLFLLQNEEFDWSELTPFYQSVLQVWQIFSDKQDPTVELGMWLFEEPLHFSHFIRTNCLSSPSLQASLRQAGCVKLGHLMGTSVARLGELTGIWSSRLPHRLVVEVCASLPGPLRAYAGNHTLSDQLDDECEYAFPSLTVSPAEGEWQGE